MKLRNFPSCRRFAPLASGVIFTMAALSQAIHAQTTANGLRDGFFSRSRSRQTLHPPQSL